MVNMGQVFKTIRKSRKLSLAEVTGGTFSQAMLSRFENDQTAISAEKLFQALDAIYLDVGEFAHLMADSYQSKLDRFIEKVTSLANQKDKASLMAIIQEQEILALTGPRGKYHRLLGIIAKTYLASQDDQTEVAKDDLVFLHDYLFETEVWGAFELLLFQHTSESLSASLYLTYSKEMMIRAVHLMTYPRNYRTIHAILLNGFFRCLDCCDFEGATFFDEHIRNYFDHDRDVYLRIVYRFAKGYEAHLLGKVKGKEEMEKMVAILEQLDVSESASYYREIIDKVT